MTADAGYVIPHGAPLYSSAYPGSNYNLGEIEPLPSADFFSCGECLGQGTQGKVFEVALWEGSVQNLYAMKVARRCDRIDREAALLRSLRHENVMSASRIFAKGEHLYILMPRMTGSLAQLIEAKAVCTPAQLLHIMRSVAAGMHYLHTQNPPILHRDLKAANVLVHLESGSVRIADFGISRHVDTLSSAFSDPRYSPPEAQSQQLDLKSDVWNFGLLVGELLTRQVPYYFVADATAAKLYSAITTQHPFRTAKRALQKANLLFTRYTSEDNFAYERACIVFDACVQHNPAERPSFAAILDAL